MLRSGDTGLLVLQTPEEKAALAVLFSSPGWAIVDAAIQMARETHRDALEEVAFRDIASETEAGRRVGLLQGRLEAFGEVLGNLREQLEGKPPLDSPGSNTGEGDLLGIPPTPPQEEGQFDGSEW